MSSITKETIVSQLESEEEFPISLSEVWEWLGFSTKGNAQKGFERLELNEGEDFEVVIQKDNNLKGSRALSETRLTIDCFKLWAMSAQTSKGKEVRRYYLQVEKEWKAQKSTIPQISSDQVEAFQFQKDIFAPWVHDHPIAAGIFKSWQGIQAVLPFVESQALGPSSEAQKALDGAFLNLNRSGLMMNKLFHFLDRIPTMKALDEDFVNEMVNALSESERVRKDLEFELDGVLHRQRQLQSEHKKAIQELRGKTLEVEALRRQCSDQDIPVSVDTIVYKGSTLKRLKSAT